ncbi:hypothetical protein ABK040_001338 [Willaertia magna]
MVLSLTTIITILLLLPLFFYIIYKLLSLYSKENVKLYYHKEEKDIQYIINHIPNFNKPFEPTPYLLNKHLQTIFNVALRPDIQWFTYKPEVFTFQCGGKIVLDWVEEINKPCTETNKATEKSYLDEDAPLMVVFAGVCGGSKEIEIKHFVSYVVKACSFRTVVVNYRGAQQMALQTPTFGLSTDDMEVVLKHIKSRYPKSKAMFGCGFSLGSNIMTKYLGLVGEDTPLDFAISVSNPYDLESSSKQLMNGDFVNRFVYDKVFTKKRKELILSHEHLYKEIKEINLEKVKRVNSSMEFDDSVSRIIIGKDNLANFYQSCSCKDELIGVCIPVLFLNALDDPISLKESIPYKCFNENRKLMLATTNRGGHVAWMEGLSPFLEVPSWMERTCAQYCLACLDLLKEKEQQQQLNFNKCQKINNIIL